MITLLSNPFGSYVHDTLLFRLLQLSKEKANQKGHDLSFFLSFVLFS